MQCKLLEGKERGSGSGGFARADAGDGCNAFFGGNLKDPDGKDVLLMANVRTSGRNVKAACMAVIDVAWLQTLPLAGANEGGRSSMTLPKRKLRETSVPNLRPNVLADAIFPFVRNVFDTTLPVRTFPNEMNRGELDAAMDIDP